MFTLLQILFSCSPILVFSCSPVFPTADTVLLFFYSHVLLFTLLQVLFSYSRVLVFSCSPYCRFCLSLIEKKHSLFTALIKFLFYPWFSLKTINVETRNGNCSELATILFFIIFIFTTPHNLTVESRIYIVQYIYKIYLYLQAVQGYPQKIRRTTLNSLNIN